MSRRRVPDPVALLASGAAEILGRPLTEIERDAIHNYMKLLMKWQKSQRLVGSDDPRWIVDNIVLDSLLFAPMIPVTAVAVLDLGSGAGVPGIPVKIVRPALRVTLAESRQRRASFLRTVVRELALEDVEVAAERMDPRTAHRFFDVVVARCAGPVADILKHAAAFLAPGGTAIVAGPPTRHGLDVGGWAEVKGRGGSPRLFAVYRDRRSP